MISTKDLYWLAGLLEGEGCFSVGGGKYPTITLWMCDLDVIERANDLLRAAEPKRVQRRADTDRLPIYYICLTGARAAGWMMTLYSLMGKRRQERIRVVLETWKTKSAGRGPYKLKRYAPELLPKKEEAQAA